MYIHTYIHIYVYIYIYIANIPITSVLVYIVAYMIQLLGDSYKLLLQFLYRHFHISYRYINDVLAIRTLPEKAILNFVWFLNVMFGIQVWSSYVLIQVEAIRFVCMLPGKICISRK